MSYSQPHYKEPTAKEWRGFWTLVAVQAQNAFNEKAVQFLLIPLAVWLQGASASTLEYTLGAIFVLPYILFSPFVGWLADCFCKTRIIQVMSIVQCFIIAAMLFCFYQHDLRAAIIWFAIFAIQATILSPAKKGIVKDMLGSKYIGYGSTIIETSMVGILLAAQIGVFFWFSALLDHYNTMPNAQQEAGWNAVIYSTWIFLTLACIVAMASFIIPRYGSSQNRPFSFSLFYEHVVQVKYLWRNRLLRLSEIGICYFWCLAGSLFLIIIQVAKDISEQNTSVDFSLKCGILMAWLGGGVVLGGVIASQLIKRRNELGLIPLGAIGITVSTLLLTIFEIDTYGSNIMLFLTGAFGAAYLAPLNTYLQDNCDPNQRGNIIAAGNLIDNVMGLVAVVLMWIMHEMGASPQQQFLVLFLMSLLIMVTSLRLIPQEFIRMMGIWIMRFFYRPCVINQQRIPERGGVLIVANHVTYADALFITMVSPRPVRFIVSEEFMGVNMLGWILELFNSLPISSKNPREALVSAANAIKEGEVICIFPEGQLTRTGNLSPIRRGMELIVRRSNTPVIPIYMDNLWGSIFSFHGNRFFAKLPRQIPYHFTAAVGEVIPADEFKTDDVGRIFRQLSASCIEATEGGGTELILRSLDRMGDRNMLYHGEKPILNAHQVSAALVSRSIPENCPGPVRDWLNILFQACENRMQLHHFWLNVCQVRRVNALKEESAHIMTTVGYHEPHETVLSVLWPIITHTPVHLINSPHATIPTSVGQIVGSTVMRRLLHKVIPPRQLPFFDFSLQDSMSTPNVRWRPCFATQGGKIISMSMAKSIYKLYDGTIQLGARPRTRGMLLPGFSCVCSAAEPTINSPSLSSTYTLPGHYYLDESGFIAELSS